MYIADTALMIPCMCSQKPCRMVQHTVGVCITWLCVCCLHQAEWSSGQQQLRAHRTRPMPSRSWLLWASQLWDHGHLSLVGSNWIQIWSSWRCARSCPPRKIALALMQLCDSPDQGSAVAVIVCGIAVEPAELNTHKVKRHVKACICAASG